MTKPTATQSPPPPALPAPSARARRWGFVGGAVLVVLVIAVIVANFVRVPYVLISPGDATPLDDDVVSIDGARTHAHRGEFLFLTVQVSTRDPSVWRWLWAKLDDDVSIEKKERVIGCASYAQSAELNELLMRESQDTAKTLALQRLGYDVPVTSTHVVIADVLCDGPSFGKLRLGDVLVAVDGQPVTDAETVRPLVTAREPGDRIVVTVERGDMERDVTIRLGTDPREADLPRDERNAFMGIVSQSIAAEEYPLDVDIDTRRVSGPSAGLAFALAVIDDLTRGELTGGRRVAVTGAIMPDGTVAPVGGVPQKTAAAVDNGATLLIVPESEADEAREHSNGVRVVGVATLEDALRALERFGGDPIPPAPEDSTTT